MINLLTKTPEYQDWQAEMSGRLRRSIETIFSSGPDEVKCIEAIVREIANTSPVSAHSVPRSRISVEGAFLHGPRSQVKFTIGGVGHQKELADLLVLGSYVENGKLRWQRACFIQAKRGSSATKTSGARFSFDEYQLALLRSFPPFNGLSGVFKGLSCSFRNRTGMLGAYGLLTFPGEFTVLSARLLGQILGGRKSLAGKELTPAIVSEAASYRIQTPPIYPCPWPWPFDPDNCMECRELLEMFGPYPWQKYWRHHRHSHHLGHHSTQIEHSGFDGSVMTCLSIDEFVDSWSSLQLGEPWWTGSGTHTDKAVRNSLLSIVARVAKATGGIKQTLGFISQSSDNQENHISLSDDPSSGRGLGIISATVYVGGGEG